MNESKRARVFVVEDDPDVARQVARTLQEFEFVTQEFRDGAAVLRRLATERPDLCIVDLGLPDMDGMELVREIARRCDCGVLILTGRGYTADRVMGLEGGGDDYVVKPFEPRELVARVQNVLRRAAPREEPADQGRLRFRDLEINLERHTVELEGSTLELTTMEYQLLVLFASHPGRTFTRDEILNELRGIDAQLFSRSVDILVSRLRQKLRDTTRQPRFIKTVWGTGYTFVGAEPDAP